MTETQPQIRSIDDAVKLFKEELGQLGRDLIERRFEFNLTASTDLRYGEANAPLSRYHEIKGCEFYKHDKSFLGTLVVDIDSDWEMLNSATYFGVGLRSITQIMMGINITQPRTQKKSNVPFGRMDSHPLTFLGVEATAEKVSAGLSAVFVPRYFK